MGNLVLEWQVFPKEMSNIRKEYIILKSHTLWLAKGLEQDKMKRSCISFQFKQYEEFLGVWKKVKEYLEKILKGEKVLFEVAILEAVNNAFKHGNRMMKTKSIFIQIKIFNDKIILVRVKDQGDGFPVKPVLAQYCSGFDEDHLLEGTGRGIYLMLNTAEVVKYNRKGNEVLLICTLN